MDIREFNQRFDHVSGPNKAGEYTMRCPCHDDKTASLTARVKPGTDGRLRIFLCCHAGCSNDSILAQVGLKPVDLIIDPEPPKAGGKWKGKAEKKKPAPAPKPTQDKGPEPPAEKAADKVFLRAFFLLLFFLIEKAESEVHCARNSRLRSLEHMRIRIKCRPGICMA